jgi:FdhD protein
VDTGSPIHEIRIQRVRDGAVADTALDNVVVEAPLEIRIGGVPTTVVMRTPGNDEELVRGFLFTEGLIVRAADIASTRRPDGLGPDEVGNVLDVELAPRVVQIRTPQRSFYASSSCGVCGKSSIKALEVKAPKIDSPLTITRSVLASLPHRLAQAQAVFEKTGGLHAAGFFRADGELVIAREDVGRHNAVDKIAGWALEHDKMPLSDGVLVVSGRLGFEIVQKAVMCAIPIIAAVSAPSSAALELAQRFAVTVAGFVRGNSMNLYSRAERVTMDGVSFSK